MTSIGQHDGDQFGCQVDGDRIADLLVHLGLRTVEYMILRKSSSGSKLMRLEHAEQDIEFKHGSINDAG